MFLQRGYASDSNRWTPAGNCHGPHGTRPYAWFPQHCAVCTARPRPYHSCSVFQAVGQALAGVIWAIGWSMVLMAALAWRPRGALAAVGIALIVFHNMTDAVTPAGFGELEWLWRFLHFPDPHAGMLIRIAYPIIPWVGVMAVGYAMGPLFRESPFYERRTDGRAPAVVWRRSWLGLRGLDLDRDRSLPDGRAFAELKARRRDWWLGYL